VVRPRLILFSKNIGAFLGGFSPLQYTDKWHHWRHNQRDIYTTHITNKYI